MASILAFSLGFCHFSTVRSTTWGAHQCNRYSDGRWGRSVVTRRAKCPLFAMRARWLCAQPRALRRPGEGAGSVGARRAPRNSNVRAHALPRGAVAPARPPAAPARAACGAGARHSPVRALSMRCGPAHFGWGALGALRVAQLLRTCLDCCVCARETRLGREGACRRVGAG